jgi:acetyl esterase/lipase
LAFAQANPAKRARAVSPVAATIDPLKLVNPEFRAALEALLGNPDLDVPLTAQTVLKMRGMSKNWVKPVMPSPRVDERLIPSSAGAPPVRVYIAGDSPGASKPAVLHIHGGGYVVGSAADSRADIQDLASALQCVAVTVDYRLAPETRFPGSLEDNYAALRWLYLNATELGIDRSRIAIKGESAGGGHAAALAIAARDRGEFPICMQVLIYPMLDDRTGSSRALPAAIGKYVWTAEKNRFGWSSLLGVPAGSSKLPPNSVPARVSDLRGLPPAFIGVGSIDLFVQEDVKYAQRLIEAGVPVELTVVPGAYHGFDAIASEASLSVQFRRAWLEALAREFKTTVRT